MNDKRKIRLIGLGSTGDKLVKIFADYQYKTPTVEINSINIKQDTINYLKMTTKNDNFTTDSQENSITQNADIDKNLIKEINYIMQTSKKIIFVIDGCCENDINGLFELIRLAKSYYVIYEVIIISPCQKQKDTIYEDFFEIAKIKLKRQRVQYKTIELEADYTWNVVPKRRLNQDLLMEAFVYSVQTF